MKIINNVEFRVVSLARSGHHGIINWIIGQCHGKVCYLNGVKPNKNPYLTYASKDLKNISEEEFSVERGRDNKSLRKDYLICSYEELPLQEICNNYSERSHDRYVGKSLKKIDILVLRDPYNYFASRLKLEEMGLHSPNIRIKLINKKSREMLVRLWMDYAKEYLGETDYLKNNKIVINFNKWVLDKHYRQELAKKMNLEFSDVMMNKITKSGPGSSFDKMKYADDAGKMKVLERWKAMKDIPFYRDIFKNKEIIELGEKIFEKIPDIGILFKKRESRKIILYTLKFKFLLLMGKAKFFLKKMLYPIREHLLLPKGKV